MENRRFLISEVSKDGARFACTTPEEWWAAGIQENELKRRINMIVHFALSQNDFLPRTIRTILERVDWEETVKILLKGEGV